MSEKKMMPDGRHEYQAEFQTRDLGDGIWQIVCPPGGFHCYLILGEERALLIDTGMGVGSLREVVEQITQLPVTVLLTHAHPDHAGGLAEFEEAWLHEMDMSLIREVSTLAYRRDDLGGMLQGQYPECIDRLQPTPKTKLLPLSGDVHWDLGSRKITILHVPGHTDGSVIVFDEKTGSLFGGDSVQPFLFFHHVGKASVEDLARSLGRVAKLDVKRIMGGHAMPESVHEGRELLDKLDAFLFDIAEGHAEGRCATGRGGQMVLHFERDGLTVNAKPGYLTNAEAAENFAVRMREAVENQVRTLTPMNLSPVPRQHIGSHFGVTAREIDAGAIVQENGDVLFRIYAPEAEKIEIEILQVANKVTEKRNYFDPAVLSKIGHRGNNQRLALTKGDDGCFVGILPWTEYASSWRNVNVYVDGSLVLDPYIPVCYTNNRYSNYVEIPDPSMPEILLRDVPHGAVTEDIYYSKVMKEWVRQLVYTPPGYRQGTEAYPVIYLGEGRSEVETGWAFAGRLPQMMDNLIAEGRAVPCIVVMSNGMLRTPEDEVERYDGYIRMICEDTIPYVEANYRCIADKWHRAFAGLSMGGMQACKGGLEHPELFAWLGLFSCSIRMRDVDLNFDTSHYLDMLRYEPERAVREYKLIYRGNGVGEIVRDKVVLDDDAWIEAHRVDMLSCYKREVYHESAGEHEWSTFRRGFLGFAKYVFKD